MPRPTVANNKPLLRFISSHQAARRTETDSNPQTIKNWRADNGISSRSHTRHRRQYTARLTEDRIQHDSQKTAYSTTHRRPEPYRGQPPYNVPLAQLRHLRQTHKSRTTTYQTVSQRRHSTRGKYETDRNRRRHTTT